jgi:hypothetical protein
MTPISTASAASAAEPVRAPATAQSAHTSGVAIERSTEDMNTPKVAKR